MVGKLSEAEEDMIYIRQTNTWGIKATTGTSATMQINSAVFVWSSKTLFIAVVIVSAEHELSYAVF